ncbi:MAG: hypothetical protein H6572_02490 [Lewinellaceae bacterium]|nr:hypothetical protein [Lewinellaceae bacterium]
MLKKYTATKTINSSNRDSISCFQNVVGCTFDGSFTDTIDMIGYGTCQAVVMWSQYFCYSDPNLYSIVFSDFTAYPLHGACDSVETSWHNLFNTHQLDQLEADIIDFNKVAQQILQNDISIEFAEDNMTFFQCGGNNLVLNAHFYFSSCFNTCVKFVNKNGYPSVRYIMSPCGQACCRSTTYYCYNTTTQMVQISPTTSQQIGSCSELASSNSCPIGYFDISRDCDKSCN